VLRVYRDLENVPQIVGANGSPVKHALGASVLRDGLRVRAFQQIAQGVGHFYALLRARHLDSGVQVRGHIEREPLHSLRRSAVIDPIVSRCPEDGARCRLAGDRDTLGGHLLLLPGERQNLIGEGIHLHRRAALGVKL